MSDTKATAYVRDEHGQLVTIIDHVLNVVVMTFDRWSDQFHPQANQFDGDASIDGCMFETFGKEQGFIRMQSGLNPLRVWTLFDNNSMSNGMSFVNRLGYFFTREEADPEMEYVIYMDRDSLELSRDELAKQIVEGIVDDLQAEKVIEIEHYGSDGFKETKLGEILAKDPSQIAGLAETHINESYEFDGSAQKFILKV